MATQLNAQSYQQMARNLDIFQGLEAVDIERIFSRGTTLIVNKDDMVFHKGTVGNQMFAVLGGSIGIYDGEHLLATLRKGDTFGEMSLLMHESRSATATALERTLLFALDERLFTKLLTKRVAVQMLLNISRMLGTRLSAANKAIRDMEGR